jgi:serine O-acetyltransferase
MPDPVANAINCMLDHVHAMDQQMENMCKSLKALGMEMDEVRMPDLGPCNISAKDNTNSTDIDPDQDPVTSSDK